MSRAIKATSSFPNRWSADVCALVPVLILIGLPIYSSAIIIALLVIAKLLGPSLVINETQLWSSDLALFAVFISVVSISIAISGSQVPWFVILTIAGVMVLLRILRSQTSLRRESQSDPHELGVLHLATLYALTLSILGWGSLRFFAGALLFLSVVRGLHMAKMFIFGAQLLLPIAFSLSLRALKTSEGQFWLSFDQLHRSSMASGLSNWGIGDQLAAVGTTLRYHWLGEGVAGVLARISTTSAITGVTRIVPALGVLLCLTTFLHLGRLLDFDKFASAVAAAVTISLGQVFEVFSVGSLWGISLFLVGITSLVSLRTSINTESSSYWPALLAVVIITPLVTLAQSTLGVHFVLLTIAIYASTGRRVFSFLWSGIMALMIQSLAVLVLRQTLLASDSQHFYQPSWSIRNFMQFRGVDLYVGSQYLYVFGASVLYLAVISQLFSGLWLANLRDAGDRNALSLLAAISVPSLVLANVLSLGGPWAQQARFLVPMITLGTYFSLVMLMRGLSSALKSLRGNLWMLSGSAVIGVVTVILILFLKYSVFGLPWSRTRTAAITLAIVAIEILLGLIVIGLKRSGVHSRSFPIFVCLLLSIAVTADGQQVRDLIGIHRSDLPRRAEVILGDAKTNACLNYVRERTSRDAVIAGNWFRIPIATRESKYFLTSSVLERRTYIDGPNYVDLPKIDTPRPTAIEKRALIADAFAERASPESYEVLRSYGVEYFLVDRLEVTPATWQPYADVVLENERCFVLKLSS